MRILIGTLMVLVGTVIGLFGDYPFDGLPYSSILLMAIGGIMAGLGISVLILSSGGRGEGRHDEPGGYIAP